STGIEVEILMGLPCEAIDAAVQTSPRRVDRPLERHRRGCGHLVQCRFAQHLMKRHPFELRGAYGSHETLQWQQRCAVTGLLTLPTHLLSRTYVRLRVQSSDGARASWSRRSERLGRVGFQPFPRSSGSLTSHEPAFRLFRTPRALRPLGDRDSW